MNKVRVTTLSFFIFVALTAMFSFFYFYEENNNTVAEHNARAEEVEIVNPFDAIDIVASAAYVFDIKTNKVLFQKNATTTYPLASLTKILATIVTREALPKTTEITIGNSELAPDGDSGLYPNEVWSMDDLLALTLVASSNDGTRALRESLKKNLDLDLVEEMNRKARAIGMKKTYFLNESGLDITTGVSGAYGTAEDVSRALTYARVRHYELFRATRDEEFSVQATQYAGAHLVANTNKIAERIPSLLIGKTGLTDLAGGNLGIIFEKEPAHPVAVVVLGSTEDGRFADMEALVWATIAY